MIRVRLVLLTTRLALAFGLALLALPQAGWCQSWTMYSGYSLSDTVPYVTPFNQSLQTNGALQLNLSVNGSQGYTFTMDTGSTGMAISSQFIPNFNPSGPTGWVFYNSSGLLLQGVFNTVPVSFLGATDASGNPTVAVATVPVLGVTSRTCLPGFPNPCSTTGDTFMLGVGVARNTMGLGTPSTDPNVLNAAPPISQGYNPFINLNAMQTGAMRQGFIITPQGVQLGLTAQNTSGAFAYQQLLPLTGPIAGQTPQSPNNWQQASMAVSVGTAPYSAGQILMDTGVNDGFLHVPGFPTSGLVSNGTEISLQLLNANGNVGYSFQVGSDNPQAPDSITWVDGDAASSFINSSLKTYAGFNYLYDATGGYIGLSLNGAFPGTTAFVIPVLSAAGTLTLSQDVVINLPTFISDSSTVATSATATFNSPVTGPGSLTIAGSGAVVLNAANTYAGGTTVQQGTLILNGSLIGTVSVGASGIFDISGTSAGATFAALVGSGAVKLGGQALTLTNAGGTFAGVIADGGWNGGTGGSLTIAGGSQTLAGNNTYTGATTINSGATLALAGSGSIATSAGVAANGIFDISGTSAGAIITSLAGTGAVNLGSQTLQLSNASGIFSGTIGGTGGLVVAGGAQTLTGSNSYTGGTQITGGAVLAIAADNALGASSGALSLNNGTLLALSSFATGRSITIGSGGATVNAGASAVTLNGPVSGSGSLITQGTVITNGPVQLGGADAVTGGITSVNGSLSAAMVFVSQTGTLRGTGVINAPVLVNGRLAPGNSPGTLTIAGPVVLSSGSVSQFDIDGTGTGTGAGNYSRLIVTGSGNSLAAGGTLQPLLRGITGNASNTYTPPIGQQFQIITAQGGVTGSYAGLTQPTGLASGTRFDALYGPNAITLAVTPAAYGNLGLAGLPETANQTAVGLALDAVRPVAGVAMTAAQAGLYAPLYSLPGASIAAELEQLSPTIYGDALMARRDAWYLVGGAISEQLDVRRGMRASATSQSVSDAGGKTIWMTGLGQFGNVSSNNTAGYSSTLAGTAIGVDMAFTPALTAGAAFGFTNQSVSAKNAASFSGDAFQFELYGSLRQGIAFLDMQAGGAFSEGTATRPQYLYGTTMTGNTNGAAAGGSLRGGVRLDAGEWRIEPSVTLAGVTLGQGNLTEAQGGAAAMSIGSASVGSLRTLVGVQAERRFAIGDSMAVVPSAQLGWQHEYLNTQAATTASLAGAAGVPFTVQTAAVGRDAAVVGLRAVLETNSPVALYASYASALSSHSTAQTVAAGFRFVW